MIVNLPNSGKSDNDIANLFMAFQCLYLITSWLLVLLR